MQLFRYACTLKPEKDANVFSLFVCCWCSWLFWIYQSLDLDLRMTDFNKSMFCDTYTLLRLYVTYYFKIICWHFVESTCKSIVMWPNINSIFVNMKRKAATIRNENIFLLISCFWFPFHFVYTLLCLSWCSFGNKLLRKIINWLQMPFHFLLWLLRVKFFFFFFFERMLI